MGDLLLHPRSSRSSKGAAMSETERQFRATGWESQSVIGTSYRWRHHRYGIIYIPMNYDDAKPIMDAWLSGFVAGKESSDDSTEE